MKTEQGVGVTDAERPRSPPRSGAGSCAWGISTRQRLNKTQEWHQKVPPKFKGVFLTLPA